MADKAKERLFVYECVLEEWCNSFVSRVKLATHHGSSDMCSIADRKREERRREAQRTGSDRRQGAITEMDGSRQVLRM